MQCPIDHDGKHPYFFSPLGTRKCRDFQCFYRHTLITLFFDRRTNLLLVSYCYNYAVQQMRAEGNDGRIVGAGSLAVKKGEIMTLAVHMASDIMFASG
jgi:hypothetical protein